MGKESAGNLQGRKNEDKAEENQDKLLEDNGAEVARPVLFFLLGANAHHRRDNQRGLEAVHK
jgi:hypothetical protein